MILLLVVSFSINLELYVLMTCDFVNLIIVLEKLYGGDKYYYYTQYNISMGKYRAARAYHVA
jgi:hypothetical protein